MRFLKGIHRKPATGSQLTAYRRSVSSSLLEFPRQDVEHPSVRSAAPDSLQGSFEFGKKGLTDARWLPLTAPKHGASPTPDDFR